MAINNKVLYDNLENFPEKTLARLEKYNPAATGKVPPPRPRRIILVMQGKSEGNVDESAYTRTADPKINLTAKGKSQAKECGREIREIIERDDIENWKVYFYVSPYKRTRETLKHIGRALRGPRGADSPRARFRYYIFQNPNEKHLI